MKLRRIANAVAAAIAGTAALVAALPAQAQQFPNRPMRLVVPFVPGGTLDVVGRMLARELQVNLGQPVVVENKGGAGSALGVDFVAKSPPDGYTFVINAATPMVTVVSLQKTPYDLVKDLVGVAQTVTIDYVLAVSPKSGVTSMKELVELAKKMPGKMNYSSAGTGSGPHMYMELASSVAGIKLTHIPYKGNGPAMQAMMAGEVDLIFDTSLGIIPQARSGKLRPLMTSSAKPLAALPGVPTMESLYPGSSIDGWHGVFAPAATPKDVLAVLAEAIRKSVNGPEMAPKLRDLGFEPSNMGSEAFTALMRRDYERWGKVIRDNNIKAD